jgi:hypothetical protein
MPAGAARDAREAVRRYLRDHPDAADTPVGIRQWWLPEWLRDIPIESLELALEELIAAHEVRSSTLPDGRDLYSRAPPPVTHTPATGEETEEGT